MTESEIMQRAKMYLDKMAQGIDPISDKPVPDTECICQERISKCLTYVSGILGNLIDDKGSSELSLKATTPSTSISHNSARPVVTHKQTTVKIGCTVILEDIATGETMELKIVPARSETRYKTMGYKTKKYADVYQTSDADGSSSISELSPLGEAIINKRVGDIAVFTVEGNKKRYRITSIQ